MAKNAIYQELAQQLGLESAHKVTQLFAMKDGYPLQFFEKAEGNSRKMVAVLRYDEPSLDEDVKMALADPAIAQAGLKQKHWKVEAGLVQLFWPKGITGYPKAAQMAGQLSAVLERVKAVTRAPGMICRHCNQASIVGPSLVNGLVDRICQGCVAEAERAAGELQAAYDAKKVRVTAMLLAAATSALAGALIWAGVTVGTNRMFWMLAVGIGVGIGWVTVKAAGKGGRPVQAVVVLASLCSVFLGQFLFIAYLIDQEIAQSGQEAAWPEILQVVPQVLFGAESLGDLVFALVGGIFGAFTAASMAARPKLGVQVQPSQPEGGA